MADKGKFKPVLEEKKRIKRAPAQADNAAKTIQVVKSKRIKTNTQKSKNAETIDISPYKTFQSYKYKPIQNLIGTQSMTAFPKMSYSPNKRSRTVIKSRPSFSTIRPQTCAEKSRTTGKQQKTFIIEGLYPDVRTDLISRGWSESSCSRFHLKWTRHSKLQSNLTDNQIVNHFERMFEISTKSAFCENIKLSGEVTGVEHDTYYPRCFRLGEIQKNDEFTGCYFVTKALSLLKKYIRGVKGIIQDKIPIAAIIIQRYVGALENWKSGQRLRFKQLVQTPETNALKAQNTQKVQNCLRYYKLPANVPNKEEIIQLLERCKELDPQYELMGENSVWIVKPGMKSRGRGIVIFNSFPKIHKHTFNSNSWVAQKYIENPLLIQNRKFDIRQWVLVTDMNPLTIWYYKDCYLRFGSADYDISKLNDIYSHLTNNSIVKHSENFEKSDGCMWHIEQFEEYLGTERAKWAQEIQPRIVEIIKNSLRSVARRIGNRKNSFELLGYDFMIDAEFKPWLIEINTSPAMDYSTDVTKVLVKRVLKDCLQVVFDRKFKKNLEGDTGGFVMCYQDSEQFENEAVL